MNPILIIEPVTGTLVSVETRTILPASKRTLGTETQPAKDAVPPRWPPYRFEEPFKGILAMLSVMYLVGAIGFTGMLLFYALSH
jgi:hypothetical protein